RFELATAGTRSPALLTLRIAPGAIDHVRVVQGRPPSGGSRPLPAPGGGHPRTVFEIAISTATARQLEASVGETLPLSPDARDPLAFRSSAPAAAEVVGIFDVLDPADPFWFGDHSLVAPGIRAFSEDVQYVDATALLAPEAYPRLVAQTRAPYPLRLAWRYDVDPRRVTASNADGLLGDLRRLSTLFARTDPSGPIEVRTDLTRVVAGHLARWRSAALILAVAGIGCAAVGLAAIGLVAMIAARRRRQTVAAWAARGASRRQLVAAASVEAALVVIPPALVALAAALAAVPDGGDPLVAAALSGSVALATGVLLVSADLMPAGRSAPRPVSVGRTGARRPARGAIEATLVVVAVLGVIVVRQRAAPGGGSAIPVPSAGGAIAGSGAASAGPDPFIAAVPVLIGLAGAIVAARAFRLPMRALGAAAARGRGLVVVLGARRSTRGGTAAAMLLVLMTTTTIATFAAATVSHLDQAAAAIAWHDVGADLHVAAPTAAFPARVDLASVPGVREVAEVYRAAVPRGYNGASVELLAVDPGAFDRVTADTPAATALTRDLASSGPAIAAIVSSSLSSGGPFEVSLGPDQASLHPVLSTDTFPTLDLASDFVVVSRPALEAAIGHRLPTTDALVRAPGMTANAFEAAAAPQLPAAIVTGRVETEAAIRHSPIVDAASLGVVLAALVAAAYAAAALVAALALASAARASEVAHLRTLGLSARQSVALVLAEHLPAIGIAVVGGAALGIATFALVEPGLGLDGLLGSALSVPLALDPGDVALVAAVALAVTATSIAVGAALERGAALAASVREGIG
ncbi:MAG TPA: hypothetical protein VEY67_04615, partial [Candidatus Dormibacteraeota bacterium]|nr:hypothetical protein [Candidatus Dormibacteraeota bacterium]